MRETGKQTKKVEVITALVCDRCGLRMKAKKDCIEYQEAVCVKFTGGYGSVFGDGGVFELDLCQRCFKEIAGEYVRMTSEEAVFVAAARPCQSCGTGVEKLEKVAEAAGETMADLGPKDKESDPCPVCHTYSHKHWCWYEKLKKALRDAGYGG